MEVFATVLLLGSIGFLIAIHNYFDDEPKTKENNNYLIAGYLFGVFLFIIALLLFP